MNRENNFNIIHFLATLGVIYGHQCVFLGKNAPFLFGMDIHGISVRIIFVVTGYLITESWLRSKTCVIYVRKRLKRIFPPLILCVIFCVLLGAFLTTEAVGSYFKNSISYIWHNVFLFPKFDLPGVFTDNIYPYSVNGSLWTLPIEMMCYFSIIILMELSNIAKEKENLAYTLLILLIGLIYILRITGKFNKNLPIWGTDWINAVEIAMYFYTGSLFSKIKLKKYCNLQVSIMLGIICSLSAGTMQSILRLPVIAYMVLSFAFAENPVFKNFDCKICYEIYLYAFPIQQALVQLIVIRGGKEYSTIGMFIISTVITAFVANIAYNFRKILKREAVSN